MFYHPVNLINPVQIFLPINYFVDKRGPNAGEILPQNSRRFPPRNVPTIGAWIQGNDPFRVVAITSRAD